MAFRFEANESVADGIKRIVREQVDKAIAEIDDATLPRHEAVHQVRKRCKKIRGVVRLVRPAFGSHYRVENDFFRDTARKLSGLRDAAVMFETFDKLLGAFKDQVDREQFTSLRRELVQHRREAAHDTAGLSNKLGVVRERLLEGRERISGWKLEADGFDAIKGGLLKTYSRGRRAMQSAYAKAGAENFHNWRKRTKYHRYHLRLLRNLWRPVMQPLRNEAKVLSDLLGHDHDLAVFRHMLLNKSGALGSKRDLQVMLGLIDRRSAELRAEAKPLGERVYTEKPKQIGQRVGSYWEIWISEDERLSSKLIGPSDLLAA